MNHQKKRDRELDVGEGALRQLFIAYYILSVVQPFMKAMS